ncbi:hypothetical protein Y1Q_0017512 [Alligator mississippiensis]|uniref:Mediator of RNA polymerase II transcription subunit 1 n=1 Tax=Alligator mississippiensis TaxID=8496 RepID=A0A151P280_ALLMI|nr:hypothetical protein Y1Q_0017512 [Alligator mississippiensis]
MEPEQDPCRVQAELGAAAAGGGGRRRQSGAGGCPGGPRAARTDSGKLISTNALMEKLRLKYAQKPWSETLKLVRICMDKPAQGSSAVTADHPLFSCLEKIQKTLNAKSLAAMMNQLECLSKQKELNSHISPNGTSCYITSDMFYVEVQLEKDGKVIDVKLAHPGEAPVMESDMKAKAYLALQSLEKDLCSMSLLYSTQDVNRVTEVLHGKVGHFVPRTGGTPMNIEFYISPYQALEEELNPGSHICGTKLFVTVGGSDMTHKLSISPLIVDSQTEDGKPVFLTLSDELGMDLPACFFLKFHQPSPISSSSIKKIEKLTVSSRLSEAQLFHK